MFVSKCRKTKRLGPYSFFSQWQSVPRSVSLKDISVICLTCVSYEKRFGGDGLVGMSVTVVLFSGTSLLRLDSNCFGLGSRSGEVCALGGWIC